MSKKWEIGTGTLALGTLVLGAIGVGVFRNSKPMPASVTAEKVISRMSVTKIKRSDNPKDAIIYLVSDKKLTYAASVLLSHYIDPVLGPQTDETVILPKVGDTLPIHRIKALPYTDVTGTGYFMDFTGFSVTGSVGGREITTLYSISPEVE